MSGCSGYELLRGFRSRDSVGVTVAGPVGDRLGRPDKVTDYHEVTTHQNFHGKEEVVPLPFT
jgi:hypothetical protein